MGNRKVFRSLLVIVILFAALKVWADEQFLVNGTTKGQFSKLNITNAGTTNARSGLTATIDASNIAPTTSTTAVLTVTCTQGTQTASCSDYTTTTAAKRGALKILVNGTAYYIDYKSDPT